MKEIFVLSLFILFAVPAFPQMSTQLQNPDEVIVTTTLETVR